MIGHFATIAFAFLGCVNSSSHPNPFGVKQSANTPKGEYMSKVMSKAIPTRALEDGGGDDGEYDFDIDLTGYSLRFEKCQFVKAYSQELAEENYSTVLATQRFVVFRLCPSESCTSSCKSGYGEYMIDMQEYLSVAVEFFEDQQTEMCELCEEQCYYQAADDGANANYYNGANANYYNNRKLYYNNDELSCDTCQSACDKIDNMEDNHYLDATAFINCQEIYEDDDGTSVYAGPICASNGLKIKIGVFTDENCMFLDSSDDVENYLADEDGNGMKLSHNLLKNVYDPYSCISCTEAAEDNYGYDETKEVCGELYEYSAKCESKYGFTQGMSSNQYYDNQSDNEDLVCDFISSLKSGTYAQDGEIVIGGSNVYTPGGSTSTGGQKFALTFFIIGTVGLAVYASMLHSELTKGGNPDLSTQGGAMA